MIEVYRYSNPKETGWLGWIEPKDKSWIAFIDLDNNVKFYPSRDKGTGGVL